MADYAKWLGAGLGWAFGGPIGAIIGMFLGSAVSSANKNQKKIAYNSKRKSKVNYTKSGDFELSFLILSAVVIKADGHVKKNELDYVRKYFVDMYGDKRAENAFKLFNGVLKKKIATTKICAQIREHMNHSSRLQLVHFLFGIAKSDGEVHEIEIEEIRKISGYLYVSQLDFESIKAMFYDVTLNAYKILEIDKNATDIEVKKAYRKMVKKHHPDKLKHLGEEHIKGATEKFRQIQEAYETIQKERGL
ncbi:MAG: TerB family tellurite resistance protein [Flavobacteriaceae bacterium]|nr:TerB family tellurite resistance protein [Flavobacteriaceae bacterium]